MKFKIRVSAFFVLIGTSILLFALIKESFSLIAKAILVVISIIIMVFGALLETPFLEHLKNYPDEEISLSRPKDTFHEFPPYRKEK